MNFGVLEIFSIVTYTICVFESTFGYDRRNNYFIFCVYQNKNEIDKLSGLKVWKAFLI